MNKPKGKIYPMTKEAKKHMDKVDGVTDHGLSVWQIVLMLVLLTIIFIVLVGLGGLGSITHI